MKLHNLTPHPVVLMDAGGNTVSIPPTGLVIRAREERETIAIVDVEGPDGSAIPVPVYRVRYGEPEGLEQAPQDGGLIVSALAMRAIQEHRPDLLGRVYVVADPVRDEAGRIIGARALATW